MDINFYTKWISYFFFALAAFIHLAFFIYESFVLQKSDQAARLGLTADQHKAIKPWVFNQGFYNLFLAIQMLIGLILVNKLRPDIAGPLTGLAGLFMLLAGLILFFTTPRSKEALRTGALIQFIPPALGFFFLIFHVFNR